MSIEHDHDGVVIVPIRMDEEHANIIKNLDSIGKTIASVLNYRTDFMAKYTELSNKYCDEINSIEELPSCARGKWIPVSYIPYPLKEVPEKEVPEAVWLFNAINNLFITDYIGPVLYLNQNEDYPKGEIMYIDSTTEDTTKSLYLLNMDNQIEEDQIKKLSFLKERFNSETELKVINLNNK